MGVAKVFPELGKRLSALFIKKAASRLAGLLMRKGKDWKKALEHISDHFATRSTLLESAREIMIKKNKPKHGILFPKFSTPEAIERLLMKVAANKGAKATASRLTEPGYGAIGRPCVVIEHEFTEAIGKEFSKLADGTIVEGAECTVLRVVMDFTGRLITATPVTKTAAAVVAVAGVAMANPAGGVPAVQVVQNVYAAEIETHDLRYAQIMKDRGGVSWIIDYGLPIETETLALDPQEVASERYVEHRVTRAIQRIEGELHITLDKETRANIRQDIRDIWGWWTFE